MGTNSFSQKQLVAITHHRTVETNGLVWMAVHGAICLALRHPKFEGPSRALLLSFGDQLGQELVKWGVLTEEQLDYAHLVEQEENPS